MEATGLNLVLQDVLLKRAIDNTDDHKIHERSDEIRAGLARE